MATKHRHAHATMPDPHPVDAAVPVERPRPPAARSDLAPHLQNLWNANPEIYALLQSARGLEAVRESFYAYLDRAERAVFSIVNDLHPLEKAVVRDCAHALRSIIGPINEYRSGSSALAYLCRLAQCLPDPPGAPVTVGFVQEFVHVFRGVAGHPDLYRARDGTPSRAPAFLDLEGREAACARSELLDVLATRMHDYLRRYPSGLDREVIDRRTANHRRLLDYTTRVQNLRQEPLGGMGKPEDRPAPGNRKACPCEE